MRFLILISFLCCWTIEVFSQSQPLDSLFQSTLMKFEYPSNFSNNQTSAVQSAGDEVRVRAIIDSIVLQNRKVKFVEGYRILVYSGSKIEEANLVKERLYQLFPTENIYIQYKQPSYRVKVGDYTTRLEAKRKFTKSTIYNFPKAILINDAVLVSRPK